MIIRICLWIFPLLVLLVKAQTDGPIKLMTPITVTSKYLVPWKEVPMGSYLFSGSKNKIGHTGSFCNNKIKTAKPMGDAEFSAVQQYCTLRPEYLLEVEQIENDIRASSSGSSPGLTRILKFRKDVVEPKNDVIVLGGDSTVFTTPDSAVGPGYVTIVDPGFKDGTTELKGAMHHRFLQHASGSTDEIEQQGRWVKYKKYARMNLSSTVESETNGDDLYIKLPVVRTDQDISLFSFQPPLMSLGLHNENHAITYTEKKECGPLCTTGKHILVEDIGHRSFEANVFVRHDCEWMEVCFSVDATEDGKYYCRDPKKIEKNEKKENSEQTEEKENKENNKKIEPQPLNFQNRLQISFRHGVVKMPFQKQPYVHDFKAVRSVNDAFRLSIMRNTDNVLVVTTESRERMVNVRATSYSPSILFSFSDKECIYYNNTFGGLFSGASDSQFQLVQQGETGITNNMNFLTESTQLPDNQLRARNLTKEEMNTYVPPVAESELAPVQPTQKPEVPNYANALRKQNAGSFRDVVTAKTGWQTWMIFFGFLTGSFTGSVAMFAVFYFLRRSVYDDWYRGMYRRYQCDVDGKTGGGTGADFGNTTMGGNDASQMSTVASTMGTTGGASTMGTTSGMESDMGTTGGRTTGGGTDMVTM